MSEQAGENSMRGSFEPANPGPIAVEPVVGAKAAVRFRPARFEDHRQVADLQARYGMDTETYDGWIHVWADNPARQDFPDWPIGWILENEEGRVAGYIGNLLRRYEFGDRKIVVASTRGLVVDAPYRSYSLPLLSYFFKQRQVDLFLDTTVGPGALKAHEIFRAARVPAGMWDQASFWITNYEGFSASLMVRKRIRGATSLCHPVSAALYLRDMLQGRRLKMRSNGLEVGTCREFDGRFGDFWERLRKSSPRRLLANRSQQMLDWHFKHPLGDAKAWVMTIGKGRELAAYAVFLRQDNASFSLKRMRLVDFQALDGKHELLRPILCYAYARCQREGIHMLEAMGFCPEKQQVIESLLPHRRALSSWRYFYKTANRELAESLKDPLVWDTSCFDGDASL